VGSEKGTCYPGNDLRRVGRRNRIRQDHHPSHALNPTWTGGTSRNRKPLRRATVATTGEKRDVRWTVPLRTQVLRGGAEAWDAAKREGGKCDQS